MNAKNPINNLFCFVNIILLDGNLRSSEGGSSKIFIYSSANFRTVCKILHPVVRFSEDICEIFESYYRKLLKIKKICTKMVLNLEIFATTHFVEKSFKLVSG